MYDFALTFKTGIDGLIEEYSLDDYDCIHIEDDIFEPILSQTTDIKVYYPGIKEWHTSIFWAGINIIPVESLSLFLDTIKTYYLEDKWNRYQLEPLTHMIQNGIKENKNLIIFGI